MGLCFLAAAISESTVWAKCFSSSFVRFKERLSKFLGKTSVMPMFKIYNCSILFYKRESQFMYMLNASRLNMLKFVFHLGLFYIHRHL
jgi:hypothetical protein